MKRIHRDLRDDFDEELELDEELGLDEELEFDEGLGLDEELELEAESQRLRSSIAKSSLNRTAIFSNTRKTKQGSVVTCRKPTETSVAMTSSTGAAPRATRMPSSGGSVDDRNNGPPPRNGMMRSDGKTSELAGDWASVNKSSPSTIANGPK